MRQRLPVDAALVKDVVELAHAGGEDGVGGEQACHAVLEPHPGVLGIGFAWAVFCVVSCQ